MATDRGVPTNLETALHRAEARVAELEAALRGAQASLWRLGAGPEALLAQHALKGKDAD